MEINITNADIERATSGHREALNQIVSNLQKVIFNLSMRFLYNREDAEDATQEILVKIITHLGNFRNQSKFSTWAYSIATNHLLNVKSSAYEKMKMGFVEHSNYLHSGLNNITVDSPDSHLFVEEVKISCSTGLLLCLSREQRIAFLLHSIFNISSQEGAKILDITSDNFRKKVSLGKKQLQAHMNKNCGLIDSKNPCRCNSWVGRGIENGRLNKSRLNFVEQEQISSMTNTVGQLVDAMAVFHSHPEYEMKDKQLEFLKELTFTID